VSQPPGPPPPGYGPPGYPPMPPQRPSRTLPLLLGAVLGGVDVVVTTLFGAGLIGVTESGWLFFVGPAIGLLVPVSLLFPASTRWWGVGLLIGYFATLIVLGGACLALIAGLNSAGG
jgi:hypothetical protein